MIEENLKLDKDMKHFAAQTKRCFANEESIFSIHVVKLVKIERFQCQLYGKLILLLISSTKCLK